MNTAGHRGVGSSIATGEESVAFLKDGGKESGSSGGGPVVLRKASTTTSSTVAPTPSPYYKTLYTVGGILSILAVIGWIVNSYDSQVVMNPESIEELQHKPNVSSSNFFGGSGSGSTNKKNKNEKKKQDTATVVTTSKYPLPLTNDQLGPGYKKPLSQLSDTYLRRGPIHLSDSDREKIAEQWGAWTFSDPSNGKIKRPTDDVWSKLIESYPHGDVPRSAFPANAWQTDATYLDQWLPSAIALIERSMEGILHEYGQSKFQRPDDSFEARAYMMSMGDTRDGYSFKHPPGNGGYATPATMVGLRQRLFHSIMLSDTFTVVMGGHSAAAGHGNHFQQSYTLQIQRVLEPIFARLGVHHMSHNFAYGGLGTVQNALGGADLYGSEMDVLIWDSGMTEGDEQSKDLYARAGLLAGNRVPILWGDVDTGRYEKLVPGAGQINTLFWGAGLAGIAQTESAVQVESVPFWARYVKCSSDANGICQDNKYNTSCWLPRDDGLVPPSQTSRPHGQAGWHPGNRYHQLQGRVTAFVILQQLYNVLLEWNSTGPLYEVPDEKWHITAEYEKIRDVVNATRDTPCYWWPLPDLVCHTKLNTKSEFTPRYNPAETSIRSIIKEGVYVPIPPPNIYDPPEPHIHVFDSPDLDILSILENGIDFVPTRARREALLGQRMPLRRHRMLADSDGGVPDDGNSTAVVEAAPPPSLGDGSAARKRKPITSDLEPGQGWGIKTKSAADNCDGTWDSFCGRSADNDCLLNGHNDFRGGLGFDGYSGWLIVNLYDVKQGFIMVRIEDWWGPYTNARTEGWTCVNNNCGDASKSPPGRHLDRRELRQRSHSRALGGGNTNRFCDDFKFEFAIDGKVTSWNKGTMDEKKAQIQRVVDLWVLLNDTDYTGGETKDVELAIRMTGCQREVTFGLSHIYWA